jgi:tRNA/rRNA methyltransferase
MLQPSIILVNPQLGENIGACARAMWNCGLSDLRLVSPRDGWPNPKAMAAATGAAHIVEEAEIFERTEDAIADCRLVLATTARRRDLSHQVDTVDDAIREVIAEGVPTCFLFGPERTGLDNDTVVLAQRAVTIPLNPRFTSLNLGQAVLLVAYSWWRQASDRDVEASATTETASSTPPATAAELQGLFDHLEQELDASSFFRVPERRPRAVLMLRSILQRASLDSDEVQTLHGVVSALSGRRKDGKPVRVPRS